MNLVIINSYDLKFNYILRGCRVHLMLNFIAQHDLKDPTFKTGMRLKPQKIENSCRSFF